MTNQEALSMVKEYKETKSSLVFDKLWTLTVNMVDPYKYFDPSGARTTDDFLQATRIGLLEAINSYQEERGAKVLSWIRTRMTQLLIKELRQITRSSKLGTKISLDSSTREEPDARTIEEIIYSQLVHQDSYQPIADAWSEEIYKQIIAAVEVKIKTELRVLKCFQLKIAFPDISRDTISKMLNISKPAISQYFQRIERLIELVSTPIYDEYSFRNI
jgi:RNA polymerase sigma factor (sigma-70 family)